MSERHPRAIAKREIPLMIYELSAGIVACIAAIALIWASFAVDSIEALPKIGLIIAGLFFGVLGLTLTVRFAAILITRRR